MLWAPQLVVQMPKEPQVPVQKATMPVVQKVPGPGFQLQNQNTNSIIDNLSSVVNHFIVIKSMLDALIKMEQSLSQNKFTYKVLLGPRKALLELVRT